MKKMTQQPQIDGSIGWFETAANKNETLGTPLAGEVSFDVVVIGGGYTGLSVAARLSERDPECRIAVVDALKIGQGTSGRNAG
ncbi:MAG: FAD-dependent oxidoreductase, partial [Neisseriaceae bacterium]|nr:FAD-dependent oxidoreductase [Neisseriaceae bacterium]